MNRSLGKLQAEQQKVEIYTLEGLAQFAEYVKEPEMEANLNGIHTLDLEGLTYLLSEFEKPQAVELLSYILKHDPYIEELLLVNNKMSKEILQDLGPATDRERVVLHNL